MAAIKFEKSFVHPGGFWLTKTLCTQKEANAFSLWNNNLGYQGFLENIPFFMKVRNIQNNVLK
jgi:hypothetical protein